MPKVSANNLTMHYERQGAGDPLLLIPYLAADHACYAFQVADYAKYFTCISVDPRGAGETDKADGVYTTELFADDIAAFMAALGIDRAHVAGLSLGAAVGGWQTMARASSVADLIVSGIFPWCFTPELYAAQPEFVQTLADFVRSRPVQPVDAFLRQSNAALAHDVASQLGRIRTPAQITFGRRDALTSTRFAEPLRNAIGGSEVVIFEDCAHAPIYERAEEFNRRTLDFLRRQAA